MDIVTNPVQVFVGVNRRVRWVNENDLEPLLRAVLSDGIRIQDSEIGVFSACSFFGDPLSVLFARYPPDPLSFGATASAVALFPRGAFRDTDADNDDTLFGFISEFAGSIESCRTIDASNRTLIAPLLFPFPLQFAEESIVLVFPGVFDVRVEASCHSCSPRTLLVQLESHMPGPVYTGVRRCPLSDVIAVHYLGFGVKDFD